MFTLFKTNFSLTEIKKKEITSSAFRVIVMNDSPNILSLEIRRGRLCMIVLPKATIPYVEKAGCSYQDPLYRTSVPGMTYLDLQQFKRIHTTTIGNRNHICK